MGLVYWQIHRMSVGAIIGAGQSLTNEGVADQIRECLKHSEVIPTMPTKGFPDPLVLTITRSS